MKIGSLEHRDTFCNHFMRTYTEFDPDKLPWPDLDAAALTRLKSVPFWEEVFYTERRAGAIVAAFTETITDPVLKKAVALQAPAELFHHRSLARPADGQVPHNHDEAAERLVVEDAVPADRKSVV